MLPRANMPGRAVPPVKEVLLALNPLYAVSFMLHHGMIGFVTLGILATIFALEARRS